MENTDRLITSYLKINFPGKFRQVLCTAFLVSFLIISKSEGRVIKLNLNLDSDQDQGYQEDGVFWRAVNCTYNDNEDLPALKNISCLMGLGLNGTGATFQGRSPCGQKNKCEIIYYGGSFPQPKSIRASGMAGGGGKIRVQGRRSAIAQEYDYYDVMEFSSDESDVNPKFEEIVKVAIDFQESYAFRFELTVQTAGSTTILDSIEIKIDLGDEIPEPTGTTESSSRAPPKTEFLLDDSSDVSSDYWTEISCNYADLAQDLWMWGCGQDLIGGESNSTGYWAPCAMAACSFVFQAPDSLQHPSDLTIQIQGRLDQGSKVTLSLSSKFQKGADPKAKTAIILASEKVAETADTWTYHLPDYYYDALYNITISNANNATVLVDSLLVTFARKDEPKPTPDGASSLSSHHALLYTTSASTLAFFLAATLLQIN